MAFDRKKWSLEYSRKPERVAKRRSRAYLDQRAEYMIRYRAELREVARAVLGSKCNKCGNDDRRVLEFDHIKALHRRTNGIRFGYPIEADLKDLIRNPKSPKLQLLCANCHAIKTFEEDERNSWRDGPSSDEQQPAQLALLEG